MGLRIPLPEAVDYLGLLSTDEVAFGGQGRFERGERYSWLNEPMYGWNQSTLIYLPARSALVLVPERLKDTADQYWSDLVALAARPF